MSGGSPTVLAQPALGERARRVPQHLGVAAQHDVAAFVKLRPGRGLEPAVADRRRDAAGERSGVGLPADEGDVAQRMVFLDFTDHRLIRELMRVTYCMNQ